MWATIAITDDHWLYAINFAMNQLRTYKWYKRDFQYHKDSRNNITIWDDGMLMIQTSSPIMWVENFYCWDMKPVKCNNECWCEMTEPVEKYCQPCVCACVCDCNTQLQMQEVRPMDDLCAGQYQIARSAWVHTERPLWCLENFDPKVKQETWFNYCFPCGNGWMWGNLVCLKLPKWCWCESACKDKGVWMTYRRAPQHVFDFNNVLLIPDTFIVPMAYFIAAYLIPAFRQERAGDDLNYIQLARQELDYLVMHNTIIPGKFVPGEDSVINPGPWVNWQIWYSHFT